MLKKIICIVIAAISLITVCFAVYTADDVVVDTSLDIPSTVMTDIHGFSADTSYCLIYNHNPFYISWSNGGGIISSFDIPVNHYVLFVNDTGSVNLSSSGSFDYAYLKYYDTDGVFVGRYNLRTIEKLVPADFTVIQCKGFTFEGEEFTILSDEDKAEQEDKEYKSGVLGWFQKLFDGISDIPGLILDGLKNLYIPSDDFFQTKFEELKSNFGPIFAVVDIFNEVIDQLRNASDTPDFSAITVNMGNAESKYNYGTQKVALLDLSWYERYKPYADGVITCFIYLFFFLRVKAEIPNILHGAGEVVRTEEFNAARIEKAERDLLWQEKREAFNKRSEEYMKKREEYMASKKEYYDSKLKKGNKL